MAEKLIIELLKESAEPVFDSALSGDVDSGDNEGSHVEAVFSEDEIDNIAITREFRWGFVDDLSDWPEGAQIGTEDDLLLSLSNPNQSAILLIPGDKVVSIPVPYDKKQARHFLKTLPYEIEEDVLGSVDDLQFAVSKNKETELIPVAYANAEWIASILTWMQNHNITIESCIANYQILHAVEDELLIWFDDGKVHGQRANGLGFSVAQSYSQAFLKDLLQQQQDMSAPWTVKVYVDDAETQEIIESHIMPPVDYSVVIGLPPFNFEQQNKLNFATGKFGKKLPMDLWWKEAKPIAYLAAAAVAVFFIATFADIYLMKQERAGYQDELLSAYRTAIPNGAANDPITRLKRLLGTSASAGESSQVVYLLSKIAPVLDQLEIDLSTLNYSNREQALRINVKAKSFQGIEQLRQQLDAQGVNAELQSSNAADEGFQARLKVAGKGA